MRKTNKKILCYMFAVLLLFFGMNFDEAEEFFHTPNLQIESTEIIAHTQGASILEVENSDDDAMMIRTGSLSKKVKSLVSYGKRDLKNLFCLVVSENLAEDKSASYKVTVLEQSSDTLHRVAVLSYIHDLDGKKRI